MRFSYAHMLAAGMIHRLWKSALFGLVGIAAVSCYRPTYDGPYLCDPNNKGSDCPDGWSCNSGQCLAPGQTPHQNGICSGSGMLLAMARGDQVWACSGSFAQGAAITLHIENLYGANNHHVVESCFKALARALRQAVEIDPRKADSIPSTKGML